MYVKQIQLAWLCTLLALYCHNYCEKLCDIVVSIVIITSINHHHHCCEKLCDNMVSIVIISSVTHIIVLIMTLSLTLQYYYRCCSCKQSLFLSLSLLSPSSLSSSTQGCHYGLGAEDFLRAIMKVTPAYFRRKIEENTIQYTLPWWGFSVTMRLKKKKKTN